MTKCKLMFANMMVFSICVNNVVRVLYILVFSFSACGKAICDVHHNATFSSPPAFSSYQCHTKELNRFQCFNRLVY